MLEMIQREIFALSAMNIYQTKKQLIVVAINFANLVLING